jgi:hypothetical protein
MLAFALSAAFGLGTAFAAPVQDNAQTNGTTAPAAREGRWHNADPSQQVAHLSKRLKLTQDQQNQLLPIFTNRQQQIQGIMNDSSLSKEQRHEKMQAIRQQTDSQVTAVLNDTQKQQYEAMQQRQRERMKERRENRQNNGQNGSTDTSSKS